VRWLSDEQQPVTAAGDGSGAANAAVTVVIVTWNGLELTRRAVESVLDQEIDQAVEIMVVDNGSSDGTPEILPAEFPTIIFERFPTNLGFARANNFAVNRARSPLVLLLNNDAVLAAGALRALLGAADAGPDYGVFAPEMLQMRAPHLVDNRGIYLDWTAHCRQLDSNSPAGSVQQPSEIFGASGGACLIRRSVVEAIGLYDESLESYWEDGDFALRAQAGGIRCLFVPSATVYHEGSATGDRVADRKLYLIQRNMAIVTTRWLPFRLSSPASWLSLAREMYYVLQALPSGRASLVVRAKLEGWRRERPRLEAGTRARLAAWIGVRYRDAAVSLLSPKAPAAAK
jgi:GT2 family glycosyltransferase